LTTSRTRSGSFTTIPEPWPDFANGFLSESDVQTTWHLIDEFDPVLFQEALKLIWIEISETKNPDPLSQDRGSKIATLVAGTGFEPATFGL